MQVVKTEDILYKDNIAFIDVRSPLEYLEDHMPNAINFPILDDEERAIIGTIYKKEGKEHAVTKGLEFVSPKLKELYSQLKDLTQKYSKVVIYCFRGGMRSSSVVDFASSCGLKIYKLDGGYKSYRRYVIQYLENLHKKFEFVVLHGNTGIGKTQMLHELEKEGLPILDLELFAKNSGSVFGEIYYNEESPSQKFFETEIFSKLLLYENKGKELVFMESESKKIGRCILSNSFWNMMQEGKHILVEASIDSRVQRCVDDYTNKTRGNDQRLIESIGKLKDTLGKAKVQELIDLTKQNKYSEVAGFLMLEYYDKLYMHSQNKYSYEFTVSSDTMERSINQIVAWYKEN